METKYEETLFYQIHFCARRFDILFAQFFKEMNLGITSSEHIALSAIIKTKDCCQRDLAKILLKDRASVGKIAKSLEDKGLVTIELKTKNNHPVKILKVTKKGIELFNKAYLIVAPQAEKIYLEMPADITEQTKKNLQEFARIVEKAIKTNI